MKTTEHLFYLIRSLTKAEKRSFKLFANQYSKNGENNYTLLFDAIDKMDMYDHQLLIEKLKGKVNTNSISTLKVQLNELILKSLRQHSASYSESLRIRQNIDYIDILFEKGLYHQAKKLLDKTKISAREQANYLAMDRLSMLEFNIGLKQSNKEDLDHFINVTYPEVSEARKTNDVLAEFEYLTVKMRLFLLESTSFGGKQTQQRLNSIIEHPLLQRNVEEYPKACQLDYHIIWGHYHYAFDHPDEMYFHRKRAVDLMEEAGVVSRIYLTHARFLLIGLSTFKMFAEFDEELERIMRRIDTIPKHIREANFAEEIEHTLNNIKINRDIDEGNYSRILTYLDDMEKQYRQPTLQIDTNLRMVFFFNFAYARLANKEYRQALRWANEIVNDVEMRALRQDLHTYIRIMLILIHFNLENYELIRPLVKSTTRYLKKQERDIEILVTFLRFANQHLIDPYKKEKKETFDIAVKELRALSLKEEGKIALEYIEFVAALEASYSDKTMEEVVKG